jgi:uncharacterized protein
VNPSVDVSSLQMLVDSFVALRAGTDPVEAFGGSTAQAAYWTSLLGYDAAATAQSLDLPMLILQGERDYQVTMADYELWQNALGSRDNVTFITYPTAQHLFMALGDLEGMGKPQDYSEQGFILPEVVNDIAEWVKAQ